jgi:hypothetical protein
MYLLHRFTKLENCRSFKKSFLMERSKSLVEASKVVPKGAQSKFFAQKSFLRECRGKYRQNIRRSAKIPPKYKVKREKSTRKYSRNIRRSAKSQRENTAVK